MTSKTKKRKDKTGKSFFHYLFLPFKLIGKGIYFVVKKTYNLITRKVEERKINKTRPKSQPKYVELKELKKIKGDFDEFEDFILEDGKIGIILGARGSGKSALGMKILENIKAKKNKQVCAMGFDKSRLPKWIKNVETISQIKNNSFILLDEAGISFSSRSSMSSVNKLLSDLMLIARHKNISILFITQNSSNIEINTLRQADYLLLKKSSLLQLDFERKKIRDIYKDVHELFEKYSHKGTTYIYSDIYRGFVKNDLPNFWSEKLSKSFSKK